MKRLLALPAILLLLLIASGTFAQLATSGGSAVTQSGTWTVQPGNTANTTAWKVDGSAVTQPVSGTITAVTSITNAVTVIPKTSCGTTIASGSTLAAVPTSATLVTSAATACVIAVVLNNTTSGALTVTVTDNTATPINDVLTFSIPAFSQLIQPLYGTAFNLGVKWAASGAGVTGSVVAFQ